MRDIEVCLRAHEAKLYHLGIRGHVARSNLGDANEKRDWRIYRDFANTLIAQARRLYADDAFAVDLDNSVYALDTTTIDLSLKVFPWAHFRTTKAAVKMHTQIDLRGNIPSFIHVSDGKMHEVNVLDLMTPEGGSFTIMDRGFLDFARLYRLTQAGAFFVIRPKATRLSSACIHDPSIKQQACAAIRPFGSPRRVRCVWQRHEANFPSAPALVPFQLGPNGFTLILKSVRPSQ